MKAVTKLQAGYRGWKQRSDNKSTTLNVIQQASKIPKNKNPLAKHPAIKKILTALKDMNMDADHVFSLVDKNNDGQVDI